MDKISSYILPVTIFFIIIFGFIKKVSLFDTFLSGAKEGLKSTFSIAPSLIGLITAVTMLKASGALDIFTSFISPLTNILGLPAETVPLTLLRPVSGCGSLAIIDSIFSNVGPDSFAGKVASVMMGSTETTFYTIAVYFGAVHIKNTRHAIPAALTADLFSFLMAVISVRLLFHM